MCFEASTKASALPTDRKTFSFEIKKFVEKETGTLISRVSSLFTLSMYQTEGQNTNFQENELVLFTIIWDILGAYGIHQAESGLLKTTFGPFHSLNKSEIDRFGRSMLLTNHELLYVFHNYKMSLWSRTLKIKSIWAYLYMIQRIFHAWTHISVLIHNKIFVVIAF